MFCFRLVCLHGETAKRMVSINNEGGVQWGIKDSS